MSDVVQLRLSADQAALLTPLTIDAARRHENALFLVVTVPAWSSEDGGTVRSLQVVTIAATTGLKIKRLIQNEEGE